MARVETPEMQRYVLNHCDSYEEMQYWLEVSRLLEERLGTYDAAVGYPGGAAVCEPPEGLGVAVPGSSDYNFDHEGGSDPGAGGVAVGGRGLGLRGGSDPAGPSPETRRLQDSLDFLIAIFAEIVTEERMNSARQRYAELRRYL